MINHKVDDQSSIAAKITSTLVRNIILKILLLTCSRNYIKTTPDIRAKINFCFHASNWLPKRVNPSVYQHECELGGLHSPRLAKIAHGKTAVLFSRVSNAPFLLNIHEQLHVHDCTPGVYNQTRKLRTCFHTMEIYTLKKFLFLFRIEFSSVFMQTNTCASLAYFWFPCISSTKHFCTKS